MKLATNKTLLCIVVYSGLYYSTTDQTLPSLFRKEGGSGRMLRSEACSQQGANNGIATILNDIHRMMNTCIFKFGYIDGKGCISILV